MFTLRSLCVHPVLRYPLAMTPYLHDVLAIVSTPPEHPKKLAGASFGGHAWDNRRPLTWDENSRPISPFEGIIGVESVVCLTATPTLRMVLLVSSSGSGSPLEFPLKVYQSSNTSHLLRPSYTVYPKKDSLHSFPCPRDFVFALLPLSFSK